MPEKKNSSLVFFLKYPEKGRVQTRLAEDIGDDSAVEIYKCFIPDILNALKIIQEDINLFFTPLNSRRRFINWLGAGYSYKPQKGRDLGERMKNAFLQEFQEGYEKVIIIGSDIPDLPPGIIEKAFVSLEKNDAAVGPTVDGGYYLIGFRKTGFTPRVFRGIKWSTGEVYAETIKILEREKLKYHVLPRWQDIDTLDDLTAFYLRNQITDFKASKTFSFLLEKGKGFLDKESAMHKCSENQD